MSVTNEMITSWNETTLPTLLSNYELKLKDVFNADEFALFYQCLPNKTYHFKFKGENWSGGKRSKVKLTGMAAGSATWEKLPIFVIGKSKRPRCFKNVKSLPCQYTAQKKSWMDSQIFEDWVRKIDRKLRTDGRKIALIIDNCPAHPHVSDFTDIQLIFLPPNTTSVLQPMDQGVIRSLKTQYLGRVMRLLCRDLNQGQAYPIISILQAMKILAASWEAVTGETIVNCFKKAGINTEAQHAAITDLDDPFKDLRESLDALKAADPDMVPEDFSAESIVDVDNVIATAPVITDDDILEQFQKDHSPESDEEDGCDDKSSNDEVPERPSRSEVESALDVLKNASLFSNTGEEM